MRYWVAYSDFRETTNGTRTAEVRAGPFMHRDEAEKALIVLCGQPHFRGGHIKCERDEGIDTMALDV
jgi:hypothetical protein